MFLVLQFLYQYYVFYFCKVLNVDAKDMISYNKRVRKQKSLLKAVIKSSYKDCYQKILLITTSYYMVPSANDKCFTSFSCFATYFTNFWASKRFAKYEGQVKYLPHCSRYQCSNQLIINPEKTHKGCNVNKNSIFHVLEILMSSNL